MKYRCYYICVLIYLLSFSVLKAQTREDFSFAHISDTHISESNSVPSQDLKRTVQDINTNDEIEFVIITGDITDFGSDKELMMAHSMLQKLDKPWYVIPGNHDTNWSESGTNSFKQIFGYERVAFRKHGIFFIGTGSGPNMRMAPGLVPHEDIVWLRKKLSNMDKKQPVIFLNHYPINEELANWYLIIEELKKVNTQAILHGHGHQNKAANYEGIPAVMGRSNLRADKEVGGYNIVKVSAGKMTYSERIPGVETKEPWTRIVLEKHDFASDRDSYARPSYEVNQRYSQVSVVWQKQDSSDIGAGVIVADGLAIHPNSKGYLMARYLENGEVAWKFKTDGKIYATPAVEGNQVVIASTDSTIYSLNATDGSVIWKYETNKSIVASPVIDEHKVLIGSSEGIFRALDLENGTLLWENKDISGFVVTQPLVDKRKTYFGTWGNHFYALDKETGDIAWQWSSGSRNRMYSPASVFPVKAHRKIFISAPDRYITALDAQSGTVVWRSKKHKGREAIGISDDKELVFTTAMHDSLFAYHANSDSMDLAWAKDIGLGYEIGPSPIRVKDQIVFIPTDDGRIFAVDRQKRKLLWIHKISNALVNDIYLLNDNELLATTMDGKIVRLKFGN